MRSINDYKLGEIVLVVDYNELSLLQECYPDLFIGVDPHLVANKLAQIVELPQLMDIKNWDRKIGLLLEDGNEIRLPLVAIIEPIDNEDTGDVSVHYNVEEPDFAEIDIPEVEIESNKRTNGTISDMALYMAAESIQQAYKRYKDCKPAVRMKRITSRENFVVNVAADVIKNSIRRYISYIKCTAFYKSVFFLMHIRSNYERRKKLKELQYDSSSRDVEYLNPKKFALEKLDVDDTDAATHNDVIVTDIPKNVDSPRITSNSNAKSPKYSPVISTLTSTNIPESTVKSPRSYESFHYLKLDESVLLFNRIVAYELAKVSWYLFC